MTQTIKKMCQRLLLVISVLAIALSLGCKKSKNSAEVITLTLQSWASEDNRTYLAAKQFAEIVRKATEGRLNIEVYGSGVKVPEKNEFEGVISGKVDMAQIPPGWTTDYLAGADFFSNWVNGLTPNQLEMWMKVEGRTLAQQLYGDLGVHFVGILTLSPPEVWAHSTKPLDTAADLKGLPIRLGGGDTIAIFEKMGAAPVLLPGSDIYEAARIGNIQAFEYINPSVNLKMKFYEVAKYMYLDSSRSPCDTQVLFVNKVVWDNLPESLKEIVSMANDKIAREYYAQAIKLDIDAVDEFQRKGTIIKSLPEDIKELLNEKATEYFQEQAKNNAHFQMLYEKSLQWKKICKRLDIK